MDCAMPEMDGFQATHQIRTFEKERGLPRMPIVALTANAMTDDEKRCLSAGMDDFLRKPYGRSELEAMLDCWLPVRRAETAVVDEAALERLAALRGPEHPDPLRRLIDLYLENAPKLLERMSHGVAHDSPEPLADAAHQLKSTSRTLGIYRLADICELLEERGRRGEARQCRSVLEDALRLFNEAAKELARAR
jgi:CheY-like chemotaxis protein